MSIKSTDKLFESQSKTLVHLLVLAYTSQTSCRILYYDQILLNTLPLNRIVDLSNCNESSFSCSLMFEDWAGLNQNICFDIERKPSEPTKISIDEFDALSEIDLDMIEEEFNDSSTYDKRSIEVKECPIIIPPSPASVSVSVSSNTPKGCKHLCKDKFSCAHVCCKSGLLLKRSATDNLSPPPNNSKKTNATTFLSGSRRTLSNAREYLRKYQPIDIKDCSVNSSLLPNATNFTNDLYEEIEFVLR